MGETLVRMPKLADTLVEGTLGQWLKQVGDEVRQGEPLASIETDKVTTEISSPTAGTLLEVLVAEGKTVAVETPIARIGSAAAADPAAAQESPATLVEPSALPAASAADAPSVAPKPTPVAARLLAEHGIDARQIASRPGRLTKHDVLRHLETQPVTRIGLLSPLTPMRRAIADHMTRAFRTIPHGQTVMATNMTRLVAWRERHRDTFQQEHGANLTFTVLFVHALANTLAPDQRGPVNLGVAVALNGGLIVPVLQAAETLSLGATALAIADLAARARASTLSPDETQGASMTLTNVGSFGNLTASPIIPMAQLGILGPGLVERRPFPAPDGGIRVGWSCLLSFMFDRRALSDLAADRLLRRVVDRLEQAPD